jgi:hypothetical protein
VIPDLQRIPAVSPRALQKKPSQEEGQMDHLEKFQLEEVLRLSAFEVDGVLRVITPEDPKARSSSFVETSAASSAKSPSAAKWAVRTCPAE